MLAPVTRTGYRQQCTLIGRATTPQSDGHRPCTCSRRRAHAHSGAAARERETQQGPVFDVARVVSSHRFDEGVQSVHEDRVLVLLFRGAGTPARGALESFKILNKSANLT